MFLTGFASLRFLLLFPLLISFALIHSFCCYFIWHRWSSLDQPIDLVNSAKISNISNNLTQMVNFFNWVPDCDPHSPAHLDLFISSDTSITILMMIGMVFMIIWEMLHRRISLNSVLLLLLVNSVSGFRLELMYISFTVSIRSSLTHGFQLFTLLLQFIEITFFTCTNRINLLNLKQSSDRLQKSYKRVI